ncbi:MAG: aldo/keto reductase, partial [Marmoricola sp.]
MEIPIYDLNDGTELPAVGFGTTGLQGADGLEAILTAAENGYRLLDTAVNYGNEMTVGEAIRRSGVPRPEFRVTSKLPGRHHAYDDAIVSTHESLGRLGLEHIDLHLIHWPNPKRDEYTEAWRALVDLQRDGLVTTIGVSNFTAEHLDRIMDTSGVVPAVNQIEMHPYFPQEELR